MVIESGNNRIKLYFHFGWHSGVEAAEKVGKYIEAVKPDVVLLENAFSTEQRSRELEDKFDREELLSNPYADNVNRLIKKHSPNARIFVPERFTLNDSNALRQTQKNSDEVQDDSIGEYLNGNPVSALQKFKKFTALHARAQVLRETHLMSVVKNLHRLLAERYPELLNRKKINVLVAYGHAHTSLYHYAAKAGFSSVERDKPRIYFTAQASLMRSAIFRKPIPENKLHIEFIATWLMPYIVGLAKTLDHSDCAAASYLVAQRLSKEDFNHISHEMARNQTEDLLGFTNLLSQRGVYVPRSESEIIALLKRKRIRSMSTKMG